MNNIALEEFRLLLNLYTLEDAMGVLEIYLRRAWWIREEGRFGYITLEQEVRASSYNIYLNVGGEWKRLPF
jgi:hypothetical protein